ncbi:MAG: TIGR01777 family protein [Proteobacteria bacterium]|nr:MAG: TIGR01777 family protein [Pseudomonadota bacterium]
MNIWITGATGLVGTALVDDLSRQGHAIFRLVRPGKAAGNGSVAKPPNVSDLSWSAASGDTATSAACAPDAIINLAGASIAAERWTRARKALLRSSRIDTTRGLVGAIGAMPVRPRALLSASAIGYYGNRGDETLTEESGPGTDFLAEVAQEWEAEAKKAEAFGVRVVLMRFGIILAKHGGALPQMARPFRLGVGGRIGSGRQWMSWIALSDVVAIVRFFLEHPELSGPVNVVAPEPVQNAEFTKKMAHAVHRPALFPAPAFVLRLLLGREMADSLLLTSQRVLPKKLQQDGCTFLCADLSSALNSALRK